MDHQQRDEYLEKLWNMKEKDLDSIEELQSRLGKKDFDAAFAERLSAEDWIELTDGGARVRLTPKGENAARKLIRAHRLAERLVCDVLGADREEMEFDACEFEHVVAPELIDSICTLLGHPRHCPHGRPIPEGGCCRKKKARIKCPAVPLADLRIGETGRVAFVRCESDDQMHRLDGLRITPGAEIKLHQNFPAYVIECEGSKIALEKKVAQSIHVWLKTHQR